MYIMPLWQETELAVRAILSNCILEKDTDSCQRLQGVVQGKTPEFRGSRYRKG